MLRAVVEQHAEDAAFLWLERRVLSGSPHARLEDLVRLDGRIDANLDGLRCAGKSGLALAMRALGAGDAGEAFVAGVLAIESQRAEAIAEVVEAAGDPERSAGLVGAIAWVSRKDAVRASAVLRVLRAPVARHAALAAAVAHRTDPGAALDACLLDDDAGLRSTALRAIGELVRTDRKSALFAGLFSDERACRHAAARSALLLGHAAGVDVLTAMAERGSTHSEESAALVVLAIPRAEAAGWVESLAKREELRRVAIRAAAALGDPGLLGFLIGAMESAELARFAAHAIATMTGLTIEGELRGTPPEGFSSGPSDDPEDEDVTLDPDEGLAWPDVAAVRAAVGRTAAELRPDTRYLHGRRVDRAVLAEALRSGTEDVRALAAFELARAGERLFDVTAPAHRQLRALASRSTSHEKKAEA